VEGATIPRIARQAGLTPGSVYRRFHDKDALLETAILEILERQEETMKSTLAPLVTSNASLLQFAERVIGGMVSAYRANAGLLRGMKQFAQSRLNTAFVKKAAELEVQHFRRTVDLFLSYRNEIHHPDPRRAVALAIMMVVGTLYQVLVWQADTRRVEELLPTDDRFLVRELTRAFLNYLGVKA
jgi:AcrR family transcriptional regulator